MIIRKATMEDVDRIHWLTNSMAGQGLMLPRSKYKIVTMLTSFHVACSADGKVLGSGALSPLWTDLAEIMAVSVDPAAQGQGVGRQLVASLIQEAKALKVPEIITLTYQVEFFKKLGFKVSDKDKFPRKLWRECLECPKLEACDETAMNYMITEDKSRIGHPAAG